MIIDGRTLPTDTLLEADICIVGAGAAGIALALRLEAPGQDIILLESGGEHHDDRQQTLARGDHSGAPYVDLDVTSLRQLGGTTNHWGGQSLYLDPHDIAHRPFVPDSGWPIAYEDYSRFLPFAAEMCGLKEVLPGNRTGHWQAGEASNPLKETDFRLINFFFGKDGPRRFGTHFRTDLAKSATIRTLLNAPVRRLTTTADQHSVLSAQIQQLDGNRLEVAARRFVLAAGAIQNIRLLLLSGSEGGAGLGNDSDMLGRCFMEHPNYFIGAFNILEITDTHLMRNPGQANVRYDFQLKPEVQFDQEILNHSVFMVPADQAVPHHREIRRLSSIWRRFEEPQTFADFKLRFRFEHAPNRDSRVSLGDQVDAFGDRLPHVHFAFGDLETKTLSMVTRRFAEALGAAGLGRGGFRKDDIDAWTESPGWQYHHLGGTRMSVDPADGVVDANCRVHGTDNLYVAGSSVFPTSGHANPTLNLVAIALRLGDHLSSRTAQ